MAGNTIKDGFISLAEQRRDARRRLIAAAVVGVVTFGLGVGLVAALRSPLDVTASASEAQPASEAEEAAHPPSSIQGGSAEQALPADAPSPTPSGEGAGLEDDAPEEAPAEPAKAGDEDSTPPPDGEPEDEEKADEDALAAADDEAAGEEPGEDGGGEAAPAEIAPGQWWKGLAGRRCAIVFKEHARLIMREGELHRDEETTYGPFVDSPVALRVRKSRGPIVIPHHFGIHPRTGEPALAYVTVHQQGRSVDGILPLLIGDDQLRLRPLGEGEEP